MLFLGSFSNQSRTFKFNGKFKKGERLCVKNQQNFSIYLNMEFPEEPFFFLFNFKGLFNQM